MKRYERSEVILEGRIDTGRVTDRDHIEEQSASGREPRAENALGVSDRYLLPRSQVYRVSDARQSPRTSVSTETRGEP
jgi:hypothetical protein